MAGLENQVALITAATSKIGYSYAKRLLQKGVKVAYYNNMYQLLGSR